MTFYFFWSKNYDIHPFLKNSPAIFKKKLEAFFYHVTFKIFFIYSHNKQKENVFAPLNESNETQSDVAWLERVLSKSNKKLSKKIYLMLSLFVLISLLNEPPFIIIIILSMCFIGCNKSEKQNVKQVQMNTTYNMYMTDINISVDSKAILRMMVLILNKMTAC